MTGIELWSTTAASNNSTPPNGWPEGQAPSTVNDCARQMMASIRTWYQDAEWIYWGDTTVYVSGTSFKIAGSDVTARYSVGRRIRAVGSSTGTIYGKIITSAFSTDTTVTLIWDSGSLSNETLTVSLAAVKGATTARSVDLDAVTQYGTAIASASTVNLDSATGDYAHITGTTTITAITLASGRRRIVVFDGILTLTHNGTSLILPSAANITTAVGDVFVFEGEGSGNTRCIDYCLKSGQQSITGTFASAITAPSFTPSSGTVPSNGFYYPAANTIGIAINSALKCEITTTGIYFAGAGSPGTTPSATQSGILLADPQQTSPSQSSSGTTTTSVPHWQFINGNGTVGSISTNGTATAFNTSSDYRLKENILPLEDALSTVSRLKPSSFTWKADGKNDAGFIAHELQEVIPNAVTGEKDAEDYQAVDPRFIVVYLVAAIQELQARLSKLEQ